MSKIYSMEQWRKDRTFSAEVGQQVSEEVYEEMLNCISPYNIPHSKAQWALENLQIPVHAGFLMGEPNRTDKDGNELYLAFGRNDFGKGTKYYYLGLSKREPEMNGTYYYFDCLNAVLNKFFKSSDFESENEAIGVAANYEADLYRCTFENGELISKESIYTAMDCFN